MFLKKILSIDIGSQNIKIAYGKYNKNKIYIDKLIITYTPLHCIEDGNITDKIKLTEAIGQVLAINGIKTKDVIFTTNSTDIISREVLVPDVEDEELDTVVQFEIQQYLPIIMEDYIVQYNVLEHVKDESSGGIVNKLNALTVTYPKHMAEQYLKLAEELQLKPEALDVNFNAVSKLFKNSFDINGEIFVKEQTTAVIDMGAEKISINIFSDGKMVFNRIISSGGNVIDRNIARSFDVNLEEAEKRKKEFCDLLGEKGIAHMEEANAVIRETVDSWIDEIRRVLQFYTNKKVGNKIDKIFIHGGTSRLKDLAGYMENNLNIPVSNINSISNVVLGKDVVKENMDYFLNGIGALIRL
ncbi:type IV pilus assembly protein PilM [Clostridium magnum]|uniref:Cell division protein FtsA n=1 Tax=Clostridium magnum DSM 2767 TaxID=1121326 RepID=A0A161Y5C3_9CLOT|nr:type IV pilus assembly protein PilM [Clostridium magnum]KZL93399.1 cell division protein FtsA [Clostridium magnum DSM 2767]SHI15861.1 type IV pilus assembly protein PilM [Clostridium magnum DSM 2767]